MPFQIPRFGDITEEMVARFERDGFLVIEDCLDKTQISALQASFPRIFAGDFDTGVYPDEWHWREGVSLPDVTRHMGNAWKSDLAIARLGLSEDVGRAAMRLSGWSGVKLGQDTIWWKTPQSKAVTFHQDTSFMDFLRPQQTLTCWFTLDDTHPDAGTIEYARGSHRWPLTPLPQDFHAPEDYRALMLHSAAAAGVADPEIVQIEVPAGSCVFHAGEAWHGSGPNLTSETIRRSIGLHLLPKSVTFSDAPGGYIYRRYQRTGDPTLDESYFPLLCSEDGQRTEWLEGYCQTGRRELPA